MLLSIFEQVLMWPQSLDVFGEVEVTVAGVEAADMAVPAQQ